MPVAMTICVVSAMPGICMGVMVTRPSASDTALEVELSTIGEVGQAPCGGQIRRPEQRALARY